MTNKRILKYTNELKELSNKLESYNHHLADKIYNLAVDINIEVNN